MKRRWGQTNKRDAVGQIVERDISERVHHRMHEELEDIYNQKEDNSESDDDWEEIPPADLSSRVKIAADQSVKIHLPTWLQEHHQDPAYQVVFVSTLLLVLTAHQQDFLPRLKSHLLTCLNGGLAIGEEPEYSAEDLDELDFENDTIYPHATAGFNYTTYNVQRDHDTINVNTSCCNVMVLANEDPSEGTRAHPFWYWCLSCQSPIWANISSEKNSDRVSLGKMVWPRP